jgi:5-methylcytosine-specific restriction endonuclease McrBC GTP-binding regulatory subunit McrB
VSKDNCDNIGFERKDGVFKEFCKKTIGVKNKKQRNIPLIPANGISFEIVYESLLNDVKRGAITTYERRYRTGSLSFKSGRLRYENGKTESEDNMKLMYDYYIENQIWDLSEYEKEDFWKLISQLTQGRTKTLDYVEYGWTLQQLLNRAKEFLNKGNKEIVVDDPIASDEVEINEVTKPFVFIIDEINRGEISKIFGELFFSIDPGYRGAKGRVKTQYQNLVEEGDMFSDGFFVPENVYIIGTMNDIDRSVESMDFAFRRRFAFAEVKAEDNVKMLDSLEELGLKDDAINTMMSLNKTISEIDGLSPAYHIGASYFLKLKEYDGDWEALWNYHLEGLLREYLRGMPNMDELMEKLENAYLER